MRTYRLILLAYPKGLPRTALKVRTVLPDAAMTATQWVTHHAQVNKVNISLADRPLNEC
jgi:hypothetical protein